MYLGKQVLNTGVHNSGLQWVLVLDALEKNMTDQEMGLCGCLSYGLETWSPWALSQEIQS